MKGVLLALLANLMLFSNLYAQVENPFNLEIPADSMAKLLELADALALTNQMNVKSIKVERSLYHPNDTPGVIVYFQGKDSGEGVYEFANQVIKNNSWLSNSERREAGLKPSDGVPTAATEWTATGDIYKWKTLKVELDGGEIFVWFGNEFNAGSTRLYVERFIEWTKANPQDFKHKLNDLSGVGVVIDGPPTFGNKKIIRFNFNERLRGVGYMFDVTDDNFIYKGISKWMS